MKTATLLAMLPLALAGTLLPEPKSPYTGVKKPFIAAQADNVQTNGSNSVYPVHTFEQRWWPWRGLTFDEGWWPTIKPLQEADARLYGLPNRLLSLPRRGGASGGYQYSRSAAGTQKTEFG